MSIWSNVQASTTKFTPKTKMGVHLFVDDVSKTEPFYRHFLNMEPVHKDENSARFESDDPAILVTLTKSNTPTTCAGHYGLQMKNTQFVQEATDRLAQNGFKLINENDVACCYAIQTKVWAADPEGNRWEIFVTTEDDASEGCGPDCICHVQFERTFAACN